MAERGKADRLMRFGVAMPESLLAPFDLWIKRSGMPSRSDAIRHLVREFIAKGKWKEEEGVVSGTITMMYDHHSYDLTGELTAIQHDFGDLIICTTHVHLNHGTCLECLVVKGEVNRIKKLEESLMGLKGMKSVQAVITAEF